MATYTTYSPWYKTNENSLYLELLDIRPIPAEDDDITYSIEPQYRYRPDLLAYDLYGSPKLWWVFAQRNMGIIKDPIFDFEPGKKIKIPKQSNLKRFLGV
jgi:hypothetical protein